MKPFHDPDEEPEALCRNCEYFDGGGLGPHHELTNHRGDCCNKASPRFTTLADDTCNKFFPCSTRWPHADHD